MENFFWNGNFYSDLTECCNCNDWDKGEIGSYPADFILEVGLSKLEAIETLTPEWIIEHIDDERYSEDNCDVEASLIIRVLNENINFDKINSLMPKLYYESNEKYKFTKQDLLDAIAQE